LLLISVRNPDLRRRHFIGSARQARRGLPVGTRYQLKAGLRLLQHGGNAVDEAWLPYLLLQSLSSLTFLSVAKCPILIKTSRYKSNGVAVIEGMGQAPMKATREFLLTE